MAYIQADHVLAVTQIIGIIVRQHAHAEMVGHKIVCIGAQRNAGTKAEGPGHLVLIPDTIPVGCQIFILNGAGCQLGSAVAPLGIVHTAQAEGHGFQVGKVGHFLLYFGQILDFHHRQVHGGDCLIKGLVSQSNFPGKIHVRSFCIAISNILNILQRCLGVDQTHLLRIGKERNQANFLVSDSRHCQGCFRIRANVSAKLNAKFHAHIMGCTLNHGNSRHGIVSGSNG